MELREANGKAATRGHASEAGNQNVTDFLLAGLTDRCSRRRIFWIKCFPTFHALVGP